MSEIIWKWLGLLLIVEGHIKPVATSFTVMMIFEPSRKTVIETRDSLRWFFSQLFVINQYLNNSLGIDVIRTTSFIRVLR